jgi:hypothetical protein
LAVLSKGGVSIMGPTPPLIRDARHGFRVTSDTVAQAAVMVPNTFVADRTESAGIARSRSKRRPKPLEATQDVKEQANSSDENVKDQAESGNGGRP